MTLTLYALEGCPDCETVQETLDAHDLAYDIHWVEAAFSTRDVVKSVSNQRSVPVLEDDERSVVMAKTDRILDYIETTVA